MIVLEHGGVLCWTELKLWHVDEVNIDTVQRFWIGKISDTPPEFNTAPEKWWLEDYFPFGMVTFQGRTVKLPGDKIAMIQAGHDFFRLLMAWFHFPWRAGYIIKLERWSFLIPLLDTVYHHFIILVFDICMFQEFIRSNLRFLWRKLYVAIGHTNKIIYINLVQSANSNKFL